MKKKENASEERYYEPFRRPESESDESVFLNAAKTLKITITDGDYTLREGIDYTILYIRGHGDTEMVWSAMVGGEGKYGALFLFSNEYRASLGELTPEREENFRSIMELYHLKDHEDDEFS